MCCWGSRTKTDIHYAMPVKNAIYDALQYGRQVSEIAARHRAERKHRNLEKKVSDGGYLAGFYKKDPAYPGDHARDPLRGRGMGWTDIAARDDGNRESGAFKICSGLSDTFD